MLGTNLYEGISLRPCDDHSLHQTKDHLIDLLSETLLNRFEDMSHGILCAMRITNFCYWPEVDRNDGELVFFLMKNDQTTQNMTTTKLTDVIFA